MEDLPYRAISPARYAKLIGYFECAFFGVSNEDNPVYACRELWNEQQRSDLMFYLLEAQEMIEDQAGYPLTKSWFEDEEHKYSCLVTTDWSKVLELGSRGEASVGDDVAVADISTDPLVFTVPTGGLTDTSEIFIFYPDVDYRIEPSSIEIVGANFVISIPRCRMVDYDQLDNPTEGWLYSDNANFQTTIDVKRFYTNTSDHGEIHYTNNVCGCDSTPCDHSTATICGLLRKGYSGSIKISVATYSGGVWTRNTSICGSPYRMFINYAAGAPVVTRKMEMAIVRLAHSLMSIAPCGCDPLVQRWRSDRNIPKNLSRARLECNFGLSDGAWMAWQFATSLIQYKMGAMAFPAGR